MGLGYSVKAINDTAGEKRLVSSLLVFGVIPSVGNSNANLRDQADRLKATKDAREETATITAERRIRRAVNSNVPP